MEQILGKTRIGIKEVLDFSWCPRYYDLKNQNPNEYNLKELYDDSLHKVFYAYLTAKQRDTLGEGLRFLKYRWGKEWIKQKTNSQIICTPSAIKRDTYDAKRRAGIDAIVTFNEIMDVPQYPILVNKPYTINIGNDLVLTGNWEYIREIEKSDQNKIIQIMKFRLENNRFQIVEQMNHDLELTAAAMAFKETFNAPSFELVYLDIYKQKMISSTRTEKDFDLLIRTVRSVVVCIRNNIRCVSPDKKCYHCEYRTVCKASLE